MLNGVKLSKSVLLNPSIFGTVPVMLAKISVFFRVAIIATS
jgi:hypothetical protein